MFYVVTCRKYTRQTVRIVQAEPEQMDAILDMQMDECQICGKCSHVEIGKRRGWWDVKSSHETENEALLAAWNMQVDAAEDEFYDLRYVPVPELI